MVRIHDIIQCSEAEAKELVAKWRENGIGGVINMAHNTDITYDPWLPVLRHPHRDEITPEDAWWGPVLAFYDWARFKGKVVVHCHAGGNRSRGTAGVLLMARHGMTDDEALAVTGLPGFSAWIDAVRKYKP